MNRLRDESGLDPISEKGIAILRGVRPTSSPPGLKRKVWASLQRSSIASPVPAHISMLRAVLVGVGLMVFTATAAATIGGRKIAARIEKLWGPRARVDDAPIRPERTKPVRVAETAGASVIEVLPPSAEIAVSEPVAGEDDRRMEALPSPTPGRRSARAWRADAAAAEKSRERAQVWEALVALRRDHDPNRAAALLSHDLETNRHGALRQEALVLAIEAADGRGDRSGATRLARTYAQEFPNGRFKTFAQSHLTFADKNARSPAVPANQ